jgi:hypothetical protein
MAIVRRTEDEIQDHKDYSTRQLHHIVSVKTLPTKARTMELGSITGIMLYSPFY